MTNLEVKTILLKIWAISRCLSFSWIIVALYANHVNRGMEAMGLLLFFIVAASIILSLGCFFNLLSSRTILIHLLLYYIFHLLDEIRKGHFDAYSFLPINFG